ncbi:MAG: hypothetical protein GY820_14305, partial [Gammaproteobacteria bacterium]|nr:hypothetical protein [Gammaproteobacteria bacterium]
MTDASLSPDTTKLAAEQNKRSFELLNGLEAEASDDQCSHTSEPVEDTVVPGTAVVWSDRLSQEDEQEEPNASLRMASDADKLLQVVQQLMEANQRDKQEERENREKDKQEAQEANEKQREYFDEQMRKFHEEVSGNILQVRREMNGHFSGDDDWNKEEEVDNPQISSVSRNASRSRDNEEGSSGGEERPVQQGVPDQITPVNKDQHRKK